MKNHENHKKSWKSWFSWFSIFWGDLRISWNLASLPSDTGWMPSGAYTREGINRQKRERRHRLPYSCLLQPCNNAHFIIGSCIETHGRTGRPLQVCADRQEVAHNQVTRRNSRLQTYKHVLETLIDYKLCVGEGRTHKQGNNTTS